MHHVIWDQESGGVLLCDGAAAPVITPPRPVFFEELDLLQFNRFWSYPKSEQPLLWAIDRRYFSRGACVAEARGGNLFEAPEIILTEAGQGLALAPVNVPLMLEKNRDALTVLEREAMDFVEETFRTYRRKKSLHVVVSFSGGKDSQVVLDLVSRIIPPDEYIVIFTDTTMEIPPTYQVVEETKRAYTARYPHLRFYTARNAQHSLELWRKFGPPSMLLRWCCSVYKTSPVIKFIKDLYPQGGMIKILLFDGIRSEESPKRENYKRIAKSVKHLSQINARVIKDWNLSEVFLYLFQRNIVINEGYKYGLHRVGCGICPFGSNWYEYIIKHKYPELVDGYFNVITDYINELGINDPIRVKEYIIERQWKKRAGGKGINTGNARIDIIRDSPDLEVVLVDYKENFLEWIKTIGSVVLNRNNDVIIGQINNNNNVFLFEIKQQGELKKIFIKIKDVWRDVLFLSKIKCLLYKTTYCVHCGVCEVECLQGALKVFPKVEIDLSLCIHCGYCINFIENGCLMAKSVALPITGGKNNMDNKELVAFDRYSRFGMRKEWVTDFFNNLEGWLSNNTLGTKQVDSMVKWLKDAELMEQKNKISTKIAKLLAHIFSKNPSLVWEIIWINLFYNSNLIKWYILNLKWHSGRYSLDDLVNIVRNEYSNIGKSTAENAFYALFNFFETTPLGDNLKIGFIHKENNVRFLQKLGNDDIHEIAIAYSLYRMAQETNRYSFTVSEFYNDQKKYDPYSLFGISRNELERILRSLQENRNGILKADLNAGLDNIHLREDLNAMKVLTMMTD